MKFIYSEDATMINALIHGGKNAAGLLIPTCIKIEGLKRRSFVGIFRPPSLK